MRVQKDQSRNRVPEVIKSDSLGLNRIFPNKNKIPYTASSAEKNSGCLGFDPTSARWVRAADKPEIIDAPMTIKTPQWYVVASKDAALFEDDPAPEFKMYAGSIYSMASQT